LRTHISIFKIQQFVSDFYAITLTFSIIN